MEGFIGKKIKVAFYFKNCIKKSETSHKNMLLE